MPFYMLAFRSHLSFVSSPQCNFCRFFAPTSTVAVSFGWERVFFMALPFKTEALKSSISLLEISSVSLASGFLKRDLLILSGIPFALFLIFDLALICKRLLCSSWNLVSWAWVIPDGLKLDCRGGVDAIAASLLSRRFLPPSYSISSLSSLHNCAQTRILKKKVRRKRGTVDSFFTISPPLPLPKNPIQASNPCPNSTAAVLLLRMGDSYSHTANLFLDETSFYNRLVLGASLLPTRAWDPLPHFFQTWLRNYIGGVVVYFVSGFLWCFYIYYLKRNVYLPKDAIPSTKAMLLQISVAMKAMPWYSALPTISEFMVENGWTRCFARISDVSWLAFLVYLILYLVLVEFGIYWMHRELHDIKPLYKYLHATHHIYNKQNTLSPFAGLAFHPLDGVLQAVPHVIALFLVPMHFKTHILLLFVEAIWTANIHDCIHAKLWPVMGAGYHTIHHTTYRHNYGHFTIWMDWMFGTLRDPLDDESKKI